MGFDIALSGDAQVMAVGALYGSSNGVVNTGFVRLYSKDGTDWNMFEQINGTTGQSGYFGWSLDLSFDGSVLAVSAWQRAVYMYALSNITSVYELLHTTGDINAYEVSVSGDGSAVGVTSSSGAKIFVRSGDEFKQQGPTFAGYGGIWSGIALNYQGTIAAIGDRSWSSTSGRVGAFQ